MGTYSPPSRTSSGSPGPVLSDLGLLLPRGPGKVLLVAAFCLVVLQHSQPPRGRTGRCHAVNPSCLHQLGNLSANMRCELAAFQTHLSEELDLRLYERRLNRSFHSKPRARRCVPGKRGSRGPGPLLEVSAFQHRLHQPCRS